MHLFLKSEFNRFLREAVRASRQAPGTEICGLLVDTGVHLSFVQTRNVRDRAGGFAFSGPDVRRIVAAAKLLGQEIVGTFHSHPVGLPIPGKSDIEHTVDNSLMFLFDCMGRKGRLWKIRGGKARSLAFAFILKPSNHSVEWTRGAIALARERDQQLDNGEVQPVSHEEMMARLRR